MKVLVLGCGPAGLLAAHAFSIDGHDVLVFSKKRKSEMYGAQYLHAPIPGMTPGGAFRVNYSLTGTPEQYRAKVYGPNSRVEVSPESFTEPHDGWDIRGTYTNLWDTYGSYVQDYDLNPQSFQVLLDDLVPDLAVCTVPRPLLCQDDAHTFAAQKVWAIGDAPERGIFCPVNVAKNTVLCNGEDVPGWYRAANVLGYKTAEWPHQSRPPINDVSEIDKPLWHNCTCWPDVQFLGRFGEWSKGVLSHEAFWKAQTASSLTGVQGTLQ